MSNTRLTYAATASLAVLLALSACNKPEEKTAPSAAAPTEAAAAPAASPARNLAGGATETRTFRDWIAVCDNGGACYAFGSAGEAETGWIRISINPGPDARPDVMAGFWSQSSETKASGAKSKPAFSLDIDGRRTAISDTSDPQDSQILSGALNPAPLSLIDAIATGRRLSLVHGPDSQVLSLSGAAAALLWIDERQGRLDTVTALSSSRRGDKPASEVPGAAVLPRVTAAAAVSQKNLPQDNLSPALLKNADVQKCRADTVTGERFEPDVNTYRLSATELLWSVPCGSGAYNFSQRYFITAADGTAPRAVNFPTSGEPTPYVVNGEYDPDGFSLVAFNKGRGIGDCGRASTWVWTGTAFALKSESEMTRCWGVPADAWPTTWRTAD